MVGKLKLLPELQGAINLEPVRTHLQASIQKVFQEVNDAAVLFAEEALFEPLAKSYLGTPDNAFQELHLPVAHYRPLSSAGLDAATQAQVAAHSQVVFIVRGCPRSAQLVAQYIAEIRRLAAQQPPGSGRAAAPLFLVAAYPAAGRAFMKILTMAHALTAGDTTVRDVPLHSFPFDRDVLSLHRPNALKEILVDGDLSIFHDTSQALLTFAHAHGLPERIQAVGRNAVHVCELFRKAVREEADGGGDELRQRGVFKWVVFDRGADLLTPFMSQLTMEGRLDELQDIAPRCGWLPGERAADTDPNVRAVKVLLHQSTPEWQDWRAQHVQALPALQAHVVALEERRSGCSAAERWLSGNHLRYVQRPLHHLGRDMIDGLRAGGALPEQHAAEMAAVEERGARRAPLWGAVSASSSPADMLLDLAIAGATLELCLRRLVLHVMLRGALSDAHLEESFSVLLDMFGAQHIATLTHLEAAGLLVAKQAGGRAETDSSLAAMRTLLDKAEANQRSMKDSLSLGAIVVPIPSDGAAGDAAAAAANGPYGRYKPVSALLVKAALSRYMPEWARKHLRNCAHCQGDAAEPRDVFGSYLVSDDADAGAVIAERQDNESKLGARAAAADASSTHETAAPRTVVVVMLGGVTYAEMTALRAAAVAQGERVVIVTTDVITGTRLLRSFAPEAARAATADAAATAAVL